MINRMSEGDLIALSERAYRALLILYPAEYRREYGGLMAQVFRDMCRDAYRREGAAGVALWWCSTLFDLALTVFEQRRKVRLSMSKSMFAQLTGIFLVLGGDLVALAAFSQLQPDDHYSYHGIFQVLIWLLVPGFLFTGLGCIGLGLRYDRALGTAGRWTAYLSGVGALVMAAGVAGTQLRDSLWTVWMAGALLHAAALTAFGLLHVQNRALPVFRALPLQLAGGWLFMLLGGPQTGSQTISNLLVFLIFLGMGLAWLAIGQAIHRQQNAAALAPA